MSLKLPEFKTNKFSNPKIQNSICILFSLVEATNQKPIKQEVEQEIQEILSGVNFQDSEDRNLKKRLNKAKSSIINILLKKEKIVPKNYYRKQWMVLGLGIFGIPLGTSLGLSADNMGYIGIGLPIGMAIGIAVGSGMDNNAKNNGLQLDFEESI